MTVVFIKLTKVYNYDKAKPMKIQTILQGVNLVGETIILQSDKY